MKKYLAIFRIQFSNSLQYRTAALAGLTTQFAWGFMLCFSFAAFYRSNPDAFPMEFSHTVSYIWLQQALLALFSTWWLDHNILNSISDGGISYDLVRPMDLYYRWFAQSTARRTANAMLRCAPVLIVAFILPQPYRMSLPPNLLQFALFLLSIVFALCVVSLFNMLVYISTIRSLSSRGIISILTIFAGFLAGDVIPLPFFPDSILSVVRLLPFASMQNMPLRIYSGNIAGTDALYGMALQVFWIAVLLLIGRRAMSRSLKRVVAQGG